MHAGGQMGLSAGDLLSTGRLVLTMRRHRANIPKYRSTAGRIQTSPATIGLPETSF